MGRTRRPRTVLELINEKIDRLGRSGSSFRRVPDRFDDVSSCHGRKDEKSDSGKSPDVGERREESERAKDRNRQEVEVQEQVQVRAPVAIVSAPTKLRLFFRLLHLCFIFSPAIALFLPSLLSSTFRSFVFHPILTWSLARSGPAFIKWGQWASTRADMFSQSLCDALSSLHSNAPTHPFSFTKASVEKALSEGAGDGNNNANPNKKDDGCHFDDVFDEFDEEPVASGSIAQIHRARIKRPSSGSTVVAVKVRHPNVAELIDRDFRIMKKFASIVDKISGGWLSVRSSIEQFSHTMAAQVRLDVEGHHLDVLNYNFRHWKDVNFPRTLYATDAIVIETFADGEVIGDLLAVKGEDGGLNPRISDKLAEFIVTTGESLYLKMLLADNLMHADLHPGNIMVDPDKALVEGLTLVDAGMVRII